MWLSTRYNYWSLLFLEVLLGILPVFLSTSKYCFALDMHDKHFSCQVWKTLLQNFQRYCLFSVIPGWTTSDNKKMNTVHQDEKSYQGNYCQLNLYNTLKTYPVFNLLVLVPFLFPDSRFRSPFFWCVQQHDLLIDFVLILAFFL